MLDSLKNSLEETLRQETLPERGERMLPAALYGALAAVSFVLTLTLVNVYTFLGLPLAVDWLPVLGQAVVYGLVFAIIGIIAGWFTNEYAGIAGGGALITGLLAIAFLFQLGADSSALTMQSILMAIPLFGVSMLAAGALRWAAHRHREILHKESPELRPKKLATHILLILSVGLILGILGRMDYPTERTLTQFHELLQAAPEDASIWPRLPLRQVPALEQRFGADYRFYVRRSDLAVGAMELTVRFEDGFVMSCLLPSGGVNFFTDCIEGETLPGR